MTMFPHEKYNPENLKKPIDGVPVPYWRRAHRDWRFMAVFILMFLAITTYVLTKNLSWVPRNETLPLSVPLGQ